jgi:sulfoxide reductase heme-binding subunit YedZ
VTAPAAAGRAPWSPPRWLHPAAVVVAAAPAAWCVVTVLTDLFGSTRFWGADPVKEVEHFLGEWALKFLVACLAVTPLRGLTGWNWLARYRRSLGLLAFAYAVLHLTAWVTLDIALDWPTLVSDLTERWYIIVGMTALLLMVPLAVTSTRGWIRRLGTRWTALHRLVYVSAVLGVVHFWMSVKKDIREPLAFAVVLGLLLAYRAWKLRSARSPSPRPASRPSSRPSSAPST